MISVLILVLLVFAFAVFFLSVFAPSASGKPFWAAIQKMRNILDLICYWIFNLFGIAAILCVVWAAFQGVFAR